MEAGGTWSSRELAARRMRQAHQRTRRRLGVFAALLLLILAAGLTALLRHAPGHGGHTPVVAAETPLVTPSLRVRMASDHHRAVQRGETVVYLLSIQNAGTRAIDGARALVRLPADTAYIEGSTVLDGSPVPDAPGPESALQAGMRLPSLAPGVSLHLHFTIQVLFSAGNGEQLAVRADVSLPGRDGQARAGVTQVVLVPATRTPRAHPTTPAAASSTPRPSIRPAATATRRPTATPTAHRARKTGDPGRLLRDSAQALATMLAGLPPPATRARPPTATITFTATPPPSPTPLPTEPPPTDTAVPSSTAAPSTDTPVPTSTRARPSATATRTPRPSATPTETAVPPPSPTVTSTPQPTWTSVPTVTPVPTATPIPPTQTETSTATATVQAENVVLTTPTPPGG